MTKVPTAVVDRSLAMVQFMHPGREHHIKKRDFAGRDFHWNRGDHARKFIAAYATYVHGATGPKLQGRGGFWGGSGNRRPPSTRSEATRCRVRPSGRMSHTCPRVNPRVVGRTLRLLRLQAVQT